MTLPGFPLLKEKWLSCFLAVSKTLDIPTAAHSLNMTPRSLNRNLHELEKALATPLLLRQSRDRVLILSDGLLLLELLNAVNEQLEGLRHDFLRGTQSQSQELQMAWCGVWPFEVIPRLLDRLYVDFATLYPNLRRVAWAHEVERQVLAGEVSLGLSCREPRHSQLAWVAGSPVPYVIVGLPQPKRPWQELAFVTGFRHEAGSLHGPWDEQSYPRRIVMRCENLSPALDLLTSGLCAAWLPYCLVEVFIRHQQMAVIADPPEPQALIPYVIWRPDREQTPIVQQALALLQKLMQTELSR